MFGVVGDFIKYMPVFKDYHWKLLEELHRDNVMYVEIRSSLSPVSFFFLSKYLRKIFKIKNKIKSFTTILARSIHLMKLLKFY